MELIEIANFLKLLPAQYAGYAIPFILGILFIKYIYPKFSKFGEQYLKSLKSINKGMKNTTDNLAKVSVGMDKTLQMVIHIGEDIKSLSNEIRNLPSKDFVSQETQILKKKIDENTNIMQEIKIFLEKTQK